MANIITSLLVTIAFYLVGKIFGRVAPYLVGLFDAVAPQFAGSVRCEIDYLFDYHSNIKDLKDKLEKLRDVRNRVDGSIKVARGNADEIRPDVAQWLERVNEIIKQAEEKFPDDEGRANGWFHNLKSRYQLSKKAKETAAEIVPKIQDGKNFSESGVVSYRAPPQGIGSTATKGYEAFESRMSTLEEVMVALKDDNVSMIGISGMGGVGKTMLVQEVARKVKEDKSFDEVVMAVVSKTPDIRKIQEEIGYQLGLGFGEECDSQRKNRLCRRLKNENSILVILDDIWEKLDLEAVGIPFVKDHKVVLTSRNHGTLCNKIGAQKNFLVKVLSDQEGWNLFKKTADLSANDPELEGIAKQVAEKCANLPLAIAAVAKALKNKRLPAWKDALRELRMSTPTKIIGIDPEAYKSLRLSYDYMENKEAKSLLSLCCLLPEDHQISIQDILKHGKGLGLFRGITTLEDARIKVQALVDHLKDYCLLLDGHTAGFFRIHAVFRDVGISISVASRENDILIVRNGVELREFTTKELENCLAMSLPSVDIRELPQHGEGLQCPKLQLLLWLSKDQYSLEIPDTFFKGMEQLKVLNLTKIVFSSLPSLSNLQTLCLEKSKLPDLSRIGELKNLEILSFRESDIKMLPTGIGQLTRLSLLDLSHCSDLNTIPSNVIARLSGLEELYMGNSFVKWEADDYASLDEFKHLSHLVALEIGITDANILPKEFPFKELNRYRIFVGDDWDWSGDNETSKTLKLKLNTSILQEGINMLLGSTEVLYLDELKGTSNVLYSLDREGFPHLKHLHVQRSSEIEYVIKSEEQDSSCKAFPELESLFLFDLSRLTDICHGQPPEGSFCKLKILKVKRCGTLEKVLKMSMAGLRERLQEVVVDECVELKVIVANNEADKITFPQLHSLKLKCLPVLVSFCAKVRTNIHSPNYAGEITPEGEPHIPIPFFNKKVAFQNLKLLNIECCDSLRNLFSPSMANDLVELRALKIINCRMIEEIVEKEKRVKEEAIDKIVFRLLSYITLQDLPKLTSFYPGDHTFECPSLQKLTIDGCPRIKKFTSTYKGLQVTFGEGDLNAPSSPLFDEKVVFPNLEFLMIENVNSLKEIWSSQLPIDDDSFCKLKSLYLHDCEHLLNIFPSHMLMRLQNLTSLLVTTCQNLKHIFTTSIANSLVQLQELKIGNSGKVEEIVEKERVEEESMVRIVFPQLTSLHFWGLPKLNSFGQGIFISDWTSLKTLNVSGSDNVETLALEWSRFEQSGGKGHVSTPMKQPLFLVDKVAFPNLEELELSSMSNMKESWMDQFHAASFGKLTVLKVRDCDSLTHLLSLTIAKSLVQIKRIIVENCNMMKEVVASEEGKETYETTFSQLISLQLIKLPNLTSFCARSNTFSFLSLEEVFVEECPNMKTFCNGILKTPKLEKVYTQFGYRGEVFDEGIWKGDLNTTIQYMFEQKEGGTAKTCPQQTKKSKEEMASGNVDGVSHDLMSLLSSEERDFLVRNNGHQVQISNLVGKTVGLYFSGSWCGPCRNFTPNLVEVYEELSSKGDFEVVFISSDRDDESFNGYFSNMPWLAIPFADSETRKRLRELFKVRGIPNLVFLDATRKVSSGGVQIIRNYGVEGYPFTPERITFLEMEEEAAKKNQSLSSVLVSHSRDFLISNDGKKIPVSELEGKMVGLYFSAHGHSGCLEFFPKLVDFYNKVKEKGENFEIVLISLDYEEESFKQGFETMPWLALPFNDKSCEKLVRYFELRTIPTLVIIGPDGKTLNPNVAELIEEHGLDAYPFSPEKLVELAEIERAKLEAQTLESILVSGELDYVIEKGGSKVPVSELVGKSILLHFSAHWCPPCRAFLPKLIKAYHEIKAKDNAFEVVFISSDHDQSSFDDFFSGMPWLALPFGDERKAFLNRRFKIQGIPTVIAIGPSGRTVTKEARQMLTTHGADAYPFTEEHLKHLEEQIEEMAKGWPEKVKHELHVEHELICTRRNRFRCNGCNEMGHGWSFYCKQCDFDLHPKCALKEGVDGVGGIKNAKEGWTCDGDVCRKA